MHKTKKHKLATPYNLDNAKDIDNVPNRHIQKQFVHKLQQELQAEMDRDFFNRLKGTSNDLSELVNEREK